MVPAIGDGLVMKARNSFDLDSGWTYKIYLLYVA